MPFPAETQGRREKRREDRENQNAESTGRQRPRRLFPSFLLVFSALPLRPGVSAGNGPLRHYFSTAGFADPAYRALKSSLKVPCGLSRKLTSGPSRNTLPW